MSEKSAYAAAGVDIAAGDRAVELMREWVAKTRRPEVLGGIGGFAGLFDASALAGRRHPVLATSASTWWAWWSTTSSSAGPSRCS